MNGTKINADLQKERAKCTFDPKELTHFLDGSELKTKERKEREQFFLEDPELKSKVPMEYLSHKEKYEENVRKACVIFRKVQELQNAGKAGMENYREILGGQLGSAILPDGNPLTLHYVMFIPTLLGQGSVEQQGEWLNKAWNCQIVGTYAQTELGHGTFIRGLETTATYDPKTEEFILNSPTLTSYKWWPGGLGHSANYAIVVAQLHSLGKCHGIHPFIVQLRDEDTHMPLEGIIIGEIGCKLGMNGTNNGYLGFKNVRIPRMHMLMKNSQILPDGTYIKSPSSKLTYGTMIFVRVMLVADAACYLRKAVTIATRYSAVRHQSQIKPDEPEPQILDFVTQQYKLFPLIATIFAFRFSANWLWEVYNEVTSELEAGKLRNLPELHAMACCLKAVCTADAANGVELCRLSCGGHGYMTSSNLPNTYGLVTAMCTYEGENTVLLLQTARFLIKSWQNKEEIVNLDTVDYLCKPEVRPFEKSVNWIISAMKLVAARKVELAAQNIDRRVKTGKVYEDAWNETSVELVSAADSHGRAFILQTYANTVASINTLSPQLKEVIVQLQQLYTVYTALRCVGDILRFTACQGKDISVLQSWLEELLAAIRPNAVGIVDGFDISDEILASALGAYDGNVYERLFEEASKSPLNAEPVNKSFQQYLRPFLKSNL
ncbi:probable peroxisomal acyl-coenzyme A oxidase 1 [Coccinella septempunctata]|uniref:probable peroxisomal acyl-coenzyme A oxidase 1 n=1 Tax=Coccinella septempunctata TaxID=41139 RepID=UPI001D08DE9E|nr:probable peroxisomal acyl-coenzyme A oxidase 1 [Coccinella septempunctata]